MSYYDQTKQLHRHVYNKYNIEKSTDSTEWLKPFWRFVAHIKILLRNTERSRTLENIVLLFFGYPDRDQLNICVLSLIHI